MRGKDGLKFTIELKAMPVAFADIRYSVGLARKAVGSEMAIVGAQPHGAAQLVDAFQLAQLVNDAIRRGRVEFGGVGIVQPAYVAGKLDHHGLHSQADAKVGTRFFACKADGVSMPSMPRLPKPPGTRMPSILSEFLAAVAAIPSLRLDPLDLDLRLVGDAAVQQRFLQAFVRIFVFDILADEADVDLALGILHAIEHLAPAASCCAARHALQKLRTISSTP